MATILAVSKDETQLVRWQTALADAGHEVWPVTTAYAAEWALLDQGEFEVLLIDAASIPKGSSEPPFVVGREALTIVVRAFLLESARRGVLERRGTCLFELDEAAQVVCAVAKRADAGVSRDGGGGSPRSE